MTGTNRILAFNMLNQIDLGRRFMEMVRILGESNAYVIFETVILLSDFLYYMLQI